MAYRTLALRLNDSVFHVSDKLWDILLVVSGVIFISLLAQISIPLYPVPITGQTLAVMLIGSSYGVKRGMLTMGAYLTLGALGLPIYSQALSGFGVLAGTTGGYLIGFFAAVYVMGSLAEKGWDRNLKSAVPLFFIGQVVIYIVGLPWLATFIGWEKAFFLGFVPFIPGAIIKMVLASVLLPSLWKLAKK
jgi:biotin transport system substrate-specific component